MNCRFCNSKLENIFVDLVNSPPSNSYLNKIQLDEPETFYPLKIYLCEKCFLVQIGEFKKAEEIFDKNYAYFSSFSTGWLNHCKKYVDKVSQKFSLNSESLVIEIASNDGYLLQYFKEKNIPVLGIEPTESTAMVARVKGIETITEFFGVEFAKKLYNLKGKADLLLGNNVLAHVPDINDFVAGMKLVLKDKGIITMEFPHLLQLIQNCQFDTIYHEHFSYLSFITVNQIFKKWGLKIFDVEEITTHGGSLRIYSTHSENTFINTNQSVLELLQKEEIAGLESLLFYKGFQEKVEKIKLDFLEFLIGHKLKNKKIVAYGAAAKGNTLLNYCGIKQDLINFVVDASPYKQGKYLPGSHIPIYNEDQLKIFKPDFIIIFPWNIKDEIIDQLKYIREWGGKFVIVIPKLSII